MISIRLVPKANFRGLEQAIGQLIDRVQKHTFEAAKANTPVRSGRARDSWNQRRSGQGFTVSNSVPYINQLEKGRSKQAPKGIIKPTTRSVARTYAQTGRLQSGRLSR
jgi:superfamily II DNA/RNA helicase